MHVILFETLILLENNAHTLLQSSWLYVLNILDIIDRNSCLVYNSQFLDTLWSHFLSPFTLKYCVDRQKQKHTSYPLKTMSFELKYVVIADAKRKIGNLVFYSYFIWNSFLYRTCKRKNDILLPIISPVNAKCQAGST